MNGYAYDMTTDSVNSGESFIDDCETFLENYARGDIDVGGPEPPELAKSTVPPEVLSSGDLYAPNPPDDDERARELYQFRILKELNHDKKLGLDRFARLAALICDAKICMITFLDDKTHYISHEVSPEPWLSHVPMGRSAGMCPHTILLKRTGEPFVTGHPYIRFYAGVPIRTKSGFNIGTLCVVDYVPKTLTESQASALRDLADMVMNDLQLYRDRELNNIKSRMANSITQFTRGIIKREDNLTDLKTRRGTGPSDQNIERTNGPAGWTKQRNSADMNREIEPSAGIMGFYDLGSLQQADDASPSPDQQENHQRSSNDAESDHTLFTSRDANLNEQDVKSMYGYACRLIRETLDVEGVCFVDIEGLGGKGYIDKEFPDEGFVDVETTSSILGYSHATRFGESQIKEWPALAQWDQETELSNGGKPDGNTRGNYRRRGSQPQDLGFEGQEHSDAGCFSNQFLAEFLSTESTGRIYNDGLPFDVQNFLPQGVQNAILVPIFEFDQNPFTLVCAYSMDKFKRFLPEEKEYLKDFGSQVLSQVLKKRVIIADRAKGIFISNISHELRSPLHGILASAEFLSDTRLDVLQRTFIDTVGSCGRTLLEVINHVLDFGKLMYVARLQNTVTRPQFQGSTSAMDMVDRRETSPPADLAAVVEQVVEACYAGYEYKEFFGQIDMSSILGERGQKSTEQRRKGQQFGMKDKTSGLTVVIDIDQRDKGWICALQSGALQRIVMNLTGNALKYTLSGWVKIHLSAKESEGQTTIQITVSDSGKGISPEFLRSRLFSPFSQEDTLEAGTGLGMSIVKQVVERLRGDITVSSQVGVGTQVRVTLPGDSMNQIDTTVGASQIHSSTRGMKVFLAGFNQHIPASRLTYQSIVKYLTNWYDMLVVDDVTSSDLIVSDECPELHDYFQQSCLATRPSLKFDALSSASSSDASTPDAETSQDIYRAPQPLIVLCSNALRYEYFGQQTDSKKIINFVSKPCGPHKLAKSIAYCFDPSKDSDTSASLGGEPHGNLEKSLAADRALNVSTSDGDIAIQSTPSSPSVLIVEDNAVNSMIIATFLQKKGYSFEQAENGLVAVNAVKARPKGFDIILMDIQMPVMDGATATAEIRKIEASRPDVPPAYIVALTGLATDLDKKLAFESGMDGFLTKPVSLKELVGVIHDWKRRGNTGSKKWDQ